MDGLDGKHRRLRDGLMLSLACVLAAACSMEVVDSAYADRAEAAADGAIERGWIPHWIPANATGLREVHDPDSNRSALAFALPAGPRWTPPAACRHARPGQFYKPGFRRDWIPDTGSGYDHYACTGVAVADSPPILAALALRRDGRHAVYWRYPAP